MNIDASTRKNATSPNFSAKLKENDVVKNLLAHIDKEDKVEFDNALKNFSKIPTEDVVELRKTNENNTEVYSLVNTKNDKQNILVCRTFPNVICEDDHPSDYHREHYRLQYVGEALIDTLKEATNKYSDAFHKLFAPKSEKDSRLKKYYI